MFNKKFSLNNIYFLNKNTILITLSLILLIHLIYTYNLSRYTDIKEDFTDYFDNSTLYDEYYSKIYDKLFYSDGKNNYELKEIDKRIFSKWKGTKINILDLGCGTGKHAEYWAKHYDFVGIDKSKDMLKIARKNNINNSQAKFILGDLTDSDLFESRSFSHITCLYFTFYYIKDKRSFFETCNYWLKENGILCLHLVNRKKFDPILEKASPWPMFSLQRYSDKRITKSTLIFDKFKYEANFELDDNIGTFKEKITFEKNNNVRNNVHTFYMPSMRNIIAIARQYNFKVNGFTDLTNSGFEYQYIFYFKKSQE